jgi:hypothetical protein
MVVCRVTRHSENQIHFLDFPKQSIMIASFYAIQNAEIAITPRYGIPSPNRLHSPFKKKVPILQLDTLHCSPCLRKRQSFLPFGSSFKKHCVLDTKIVRLVRSLQHYLNHWQTVIAAVDTTVQDYGTCGTS